MLIIGLQHVSTKHYYYCIAIRPPHVKKNVFIFLFNSNSV